MDEQASPTSLSAGLPSDCQIQGLDTRREVRRRLLAGERIVVNQGTRAEECAKALEWDASLTIRVSPIMLAW